MCANPSILLLFLGEGETRASVLDRIARLGLGNRIHCPGLIPRAHVPHVLRCVDGALMISKNETFGHTVVEPLAYGVPVIATAIGVAPEVIRDGRNGYLIKTSVERELPGYVERLMDMALRPKRTHADGDPFFSWEAVAQAYAGEFTHRFLRIAFGRRAPSGMDSHE